MPEQAWAALISAVPATLMALAAWRSASKVRETVGEKNGKGTLSSMLETILSHVAEEDRKLAETDRNLEAETVRLREEEDAIRQKLDDIREAQRSHEKLDEKRFNDLEELVRK